MIYGLAVEYFPLKRPPPTAPPPPHPSSQRASINRNLSDYLYYQLLRDKTARTVVVVRVLAAKSSGKPSSPEFQLSAVFSVGLLLTLDFNPNAAGG